MSNQFKYGLIAVALLVVGIIGGWYFTATTPAHLAGSTVEINPYQYAGGLAWGPDDLLHLEAKFTIPQGSDQAYWQNTTGGDVVIDEQELSMGGTASSTFKAYVSTSTTATVKNGYTTTAPWSQSVNGWTVATGTTAQIGASTAFLTDNIAAHNASYAAKLQVPPNYYVVVSAESACNVVGGCETATSTNRGWTTLTDTIWYHYNAH